MRSMKANKIKIYFGVFLLAIAIGLTILNVFNTKGINIKSWDNYYNENNIIFFYDEMPDEKLNKLNETYKVKEHIDGETSEIEKVLKIVDIVNTIVEADDVKESGFRNGYDILLQKTVSKKASNKDMAIITRDLLSSVGIKSRIGVFRGKNAQFDRKSEYYIVEYWSNQYTKWIVVDFLDKGYFLEGDNKLSAIEVLTKGLKNISYLGESSQRDYKNKLNKYMASYSLAIENSSYQIRSNCYVTYLKNKDALIIKYKDTFAPPTVFTEEIKLFEKSPFDKAVGSDEKAYILLSGLTSKPSDENSKDEKALKFLVAGFKDDKVISSYYLNINGAGYEEIKEYKEIELEKGTTKIELSLDGQTTLSSVVIERE